VAVIDRVNGWMDGSVKEWMRWIWWSGMHACTAEPFFEANFFRNQRHRHRKGYISDSRNIFIASFFHYFLSGVTFIGKLCRCGLVIVCIGVWRMKRKRVVV